MNQPLAVPAITMDTALSRLAHPTKVHGRDGPGHDHTSACPGESLPPDLIRGWAPVRRKGHAPTNESGACPDSAGTGHALEAPIDNENQLLPLPVSTARISWSGPKSSALSIDINSARRVRARLTRLLIVPTAQPQMPAASS